MVNEEEWVEENFYFGNAMTPSDATYRTKGDQLQYKVEKWFYLEATSDKGRFNLSVEGVSDFLAKHEDCYFLLADGHEINAAYGGGRTEPNVWLMGWYEITTDEGRNRYEEDKKYAWKKTESPSN